jgi:OOP family OmpA-OmpF porin
MNKTNGVIAGMLVAGAVMAATPAAAEVPDDYLFLDGFAVIHDERIPEAETGLGLRFGYGGIFDRSGNSATGIELGVFTNPVKSSDRSGDKQTGVMLDLMQFYQVGGFNPFVFAGLGVTGERVGPAEGAFLSLEAGGGLLFDVTPNLTLRASLSAMSVRNDEFGTDAFVDWRLNLGLFFPVDGSTAAAPAPAPTPARAVDSDGDGLADSADRCPSTPASTADGCPPPAPVVQTDSDNDGVGDNDDTCPGTLEGLKVDARGCAVQSATGEKQSVVLKGVTFLPGSATLTEDAKGVLDGAAAALNGQKDLKAEIGGHTDAQGGDAANQRLSQRRADAVRTYLTGKGVEGERLTAVGYGESQPIASNDTPAGRAENRRVEFKLQ